MLFLCQERSERQFFGGQVVVDLTRIVAHHAVRCFLWLARLKIEYFDGTFDLLTGGVKITAANYLEIAIKGPKIGFDPGECTVRPEVGVNVFNPVAGRAKQGEASRHDFSSVEPDVGYRICLALVAVTFEGLFRCKPLPSGPSRRLVIGHVGKDTFCCFRPFCVGFDSLSKSVDLCNLSRNGLTLSGFHVKKTENQQQQNEFLHSKRTFVSREPSADAKHLSLMQPRIYLKLDGLLYRKIMMPPKIISILLTIFFLTSSMPPLRAFETDQYNLPPEPLADIGDEVTDYIAGQLELAAAKLNARINVAENCLAQKQKGCGPAEKLQKELLYLRSERALAKTVYELLSGGSLMTTKFGKWIKDHQFRARPASYKAPYLESIYLIKPSNYLTLSPTIRMYGHEFGIDKLEHLFQQGHQYYERVNDALKEGKTHEEAVKTAIEWGKQTERTYYGILTSGVYSNADLNANFVGLKFYEGLTRPLKIGTSTRPAMLALRDGRWHLADAEASREHMLRIFIGEHLNEAFNPSGFRFTLSGPVKRSVKRNSCPDWKRTFPGLDSRQLIAKAASLETWNGEEYGHTKQKGMINIGEVCFEDAQ